MKKKLFAIILCVSIVFQFELLPEESFAFTKTEEMTDLVSLDDATLYMKSQKDSIKHIIYSCSTDLGIKLKNADIKFAEPFVVYDLKKETQEKTYYYPIMWDNSDQIIAVVCLMDTTVGWQYTINTNWADILNDLKYSKDNYIFYASEDTLVAESEHKKKVMSGKKIKDDFDDKTLEVKRKIIQNGYRKVKKIDVEENKTKAVNKLIGYSPSITNELGHYYCNIYNAQGQGGYKLCWAASVATIVNYRKGTSYTAKNIADAMGRGYDEGGYPTLSVNALTKYGVQNYSVLNGIPTFSVVMDHIKSKKPFQIEGTTYEKDVDNHAVTAYGFRNLESGKYIILWDSNLNNQTGGVSICTYNDEGLTFTSGTHNFTWYRTVACFTSKSYK